MGLKNEIEKLKYDKRLSEWHINRGLMKRDDLTKHIDSLPDSASNVADQGPSADVDDQASADEQI